MVSKHRQNPTRSGGNLPKKPRKPPGTTPELRENQLISYAVDLAEQQLTDGTASAQVITHFLKLGSSRERLEQERLRNEVELLEAKSKMLADAEQTKELYENALRAMSVYQGRPPENTEEDY